MAVSRLGYYNTGSTPDAGTLGADIQRAYVPDALTQTLIFYEMGTRTGRSGANAPTGRMGIGETSNGSATGSPAALLRYTSTFSASTAMTGGSDGTVYTRPLTSPLVGQSGDAFALVQTNTNYIALHGMIQLSAYPGKDNYNFYTKTNSSSIPTDPIGGTPSPEGHMALWATGEVNVKPNTPTALAPSGNLSSTDLTPQMQSSFSDSNETLPDGRAFDKLTSFQIQVRRTSDQVEFWDETFTATSTEQTNRQANRAYAGDALSPGVSYQHRHRHKDIAGAWSDWSGWTSFTINAGGTVVVTSGTPSGKQNSQTPGPFVATWSHPNPLNAKAAIVRILDANNNVVQTMTKGAPFTLSPQVANGGTITVPWANTGFTALARGGDGYKWQMDAQDTGNAWAGWSASRPFTVNATPNIPSSLSPTNSAPVTSGPLLTLVASDPDDTQSGLTVTGEIKRADGTSITRSFAWNGTTSKYQYQTVVGTDEVQQIGRSGTLSGGSFTITVPANVVGAQSTTAPINFNDDAATVQTKLEALANVDPGDIVVTGGPIQTTAFTLTYRKRLSATNVGQITVSSSLTGGGSITPSTVTPGVDGDFAGYQTIQWRAKAGDGTSESAYSGYATFLYGAGPVVSITTPTDEATIATANYRIEWTVPSGGPQVKYRVQISEVDANDEVVPDTTPYDTGDVTSGNLFHDVTGYFRTDRRYQFVVTVTNATPLSGSSQPWQVNVSFTPPATIASFVAQATALHVATDSDAVLLEWAQTSYPSDQFAGYDIYRTALGPAPQANGFEAANIDASEVGVRVHLRHLPNAAQRAYVDADATSGVAYLYEIEQRVKQGLDELRSLPAEATISIQIPHVVITSALEPESFGLELRHKAGKAEYLSSSLVQSKKKVVPVGARKGRTIASPLLQWNDKGSFDLISDSYMTADEKARRMTALIERGGTICLRDFTSLKRYTSLDAFEMLRFGPNRYRVNLTFSEEYLELGES